ncbi:MAG: OmpA family protein [Neptunomonas phycophila]|uniref:phosphate ABC transporter substrate-binding/OmpA family protein n=1 Tax=Neptunomonas phycophila TaxID=1572645 RepID=UPI003B8D294C
MKNSAIAMIGAVVLIGGMGVYKLIKPTLDARAIQATSDSANIEHTINVGTDNWVGYVPFCSDVMNKQLRRDKIQIKCHDDRANYAQRMDKLSKGELDLALVETGAYTLEGAQYNYPGVFIAAIDSSKGDAIVVDPKKYPDLASLRKDNKVRMALIPNSPSDYFGYYTETSFGLDLSSHDWVIEKDSPEAVYKALTRGDVSASIMWEPYVSMAKEQGFKVLLGTNQATDVVVDALIANRKFLVDNPKIVQTVLASYFKTLKHFRNNPSTLIDEVRDNNPALTTDKMAEQAIAGARWITFTENCKRWFGCDDEDFLADVGIEDSLNLAYRIWRDAGIQKSNPFPDDDPYNLINSSVLKALFTKGIDEGVVETIQNPLAYPFEPLTAEQWEQSRYLDKLNTGRILFDRGTNRITIEGRESLDGIAEQLKRFPAHRLRIEGHTGTRGNKQANTKLSLDRANAVKRYLLITYTDIDPDRILTVGLGGTKPLDLKPGESSRSRSYSKRLKRVEIHLLENNY